MFRTCAVSSTAFEALWRIRTLCLSMRNPVLPWPFQYASCSKFWVLSTQLRTRPSVVFGRLNAAVPSIDQSNVKTKVAPSLPDDEFSIQKQCPVDPSKEKCILKEKENRVILIDGKAVVYRAYYKLTTKLNHGTLVDTCSEGDWVLTVFTALSTVLNIFDINPSHIAVIFDHEGLTFRHTMYPDYKVNRSPTPDTVVQALKYVKPALYSMGVKTIEVPGVEADDAIATLAMNAVTSGSRVRVVSPDKDFFQLISSSLRLLRFVPHGSGMLSFGLEEFHARFPDLEPSQYIDILALMGDRTDNIPGVLGIGEKTASSLIRLYGSLEKLLEEKTSVKGKRALNGLLADNGEVLLGKRLVTLRTDLPFYMVPFSLEDLIYKPPKDAGKQYGNLLKAMGSFVNGTNALNLQQRTEKLWQKYEWCK